MTTNCEKEILEGKHHSRKVAVGKEKRLLKTTGVPSSNEPQPERKASYAKALAAFSDSEEEEERGSSKGQGLCSINDKREYCFLQRHRLRMKKRLALLLGAERRRGY